MDSQIPGYIYPVGLEPAGGEILRRDSLAGKYLQARD